MMEKYGVADSKALQRTELNGVRKRLAELRRANVQLEKSAAAGEYARLQAREAELEKALADQ
jgi:hypothetical protein